MLIFDYIVGGDGLACRLGRCFCILPYAEVSTGDPHPALPRIKFILCHVRFFADAQNDKSAQTV